MLQHHLVAERQVEHSPIAAPCYRSRLWRDTLESLGTTPKFTRPYRPQTNGKVERFHRILLEEWAYIRDRNSDHERSYHYEHYEHFVHFYNHHRAHDALGWSTPMSTLRDNVPGHHTSRFTSATKTRAFPPDCSAVS